MAVTTIASLLTELHRQSPVLYEVVTSGAGLRGDRAQAAMADAIRLSPTEQLRIAALTAKLAPNLAQRADKVRQQALASMRFAQGEFVNRRQDPPTVRRVHEPRMRYRC